MTAPTDPSATGPQAPVVAGDTLLQSGVLEDLAEAVNYRHWIVDLARPWLGERPLEIGSGRGDYCADWAAGGTSITASEADPARLKALRARFAAAADVTVRELAAPINEEADYSAVVAINVLEHIEDDVAALQAFRRLIRADGHVVLFVPAFAFAMSDFDRQIGHFRRYRKASLLRALRAAGLEPVRIHYANSAGLLAWVVLVRLLHGRPKAGPILRVYDRLVVPVIRKVESLGRPPFGQSIFAVARPIAGWRAADAESTGESR